MKKVLLLLAATVLASCDFLNSLESIASSNNAKDNRIYIDDASLVKVENPLPTPKKNINSFDEIVYALDYMAFYQIDKAVTFNIDQSKLTGLEKTLLEAYEKGDIADVYNCQFSISPADNQFTVDFAISKDIASRAPTYVPTNIFIAEADYVYDKDKPMDSGLFVLENGNYPKVTVSTSEQLYYAAMHHYQPVPEDKGNAKVIYEKAKTILNAVTDKNVDEFHQIKAVYDYLTTEIYYDDDTAQATGDGLSARQAFYLEGVFLNKCAVCDGKSKAYALMLNMLGIDCYRQTGKNAQNKAHAWNIVKYDGAHYLSCTTYGSPSPTTIGVQELGEVIVPSYNMLLQNKTTPYGNEWGYTSTKYADIAISETPYAVFDVMDRVVTDKESFASLIDQYKASANKKISFQYGGNDQQQFENDMRTVLSDYNGIQLLTTPNNTGPLYQVIFSQAQE